MLGKENSSRAMKLPEILQQLTSLRVYITALFVCLVGAGLLYWTGLDAWWTTNSSWRPFWQSVGSVLIGTVALSIIWELAAKRAFLDEVHSKTKLAFEIKDSGLESITPNYREGIPWKELISRTNKIEIFFAYGDTWRHSNQSLLEHFLKTRGNVIHLYLPSPESEPAMQVMMERFQYDRTNLETKIKGAAKAMEDMVAPKDKKGTVKVQYVDCVPLESIYIFGDTAVIVLYSHRKVRCSVPALIVKAPGPLFDFARQEVDAVSTFTPTNNGI